MSTNISKRNTRLAGLLLIAGMLAGIFSVAPAVDSPEYLAEAPAHSVQVIVAAVFQFIMALSYAGLAILLYPLLKRFAYSLAIGFLGFRMMAATLVVIGAIVLLLILALGQEAINYPSESTATLQALGNALKATRDHINHVFMILTLCAGNAMLYILLIRSKLVPQWLSVWGLVAALLSAIASVLVLFRAVDIITTEYLLLNAPTALQELVFGIWLMVKGFRGKE